MTSCAQLCAAEASLSSASHQLDQETVRISEEVRVAYMEYTEMEIAFSDLSNLTPTVTSQLLTTAINDYSQGLIDIEPVLAKMARHVRFQETRQVAIPRLYQAISRLRCLVGLGR